MTPVSRTTYWSFCVNILVDPARKLDELTGAQGLARKSNVGSSEDPIPAEAITLSLIPPPKDFFTKFIKVLMEITQAQAQILAKPRKHPLKARTLKTYSEKSHIDCYHFSQQCKDFFKIPNHRNELYPFCRFLHPWSFQSQMGLT